MHNGQQEKVLCIAQFNVWLNDWCKPEGFGYVSHDAIKWSDIKLKRPTKEMVCIPHTRTLSFLVFNLGVLLDVHLN